MLQASPRMLPRGRLFPGVAWCSPHSPSPSFNHLLKAEGSCLRCGALSFSRCETEPIHSEILEIASGWLMGSAPSSHCAEGLCSVVGLDSAAFRRPPLSARACPSTQHSPKPQLKNTVSKKDSSGTHRPRHSKTNPELKAEQLLGQVFPKHAHTHTVTCTYTHIPCTCSDAHPAPTCDHAMYTHP